MQIYTRGGDRGDTSVIGGRVRKDDIRVEAYGTIDELNACTGAAAAQARELGQEALAAELEGIMQELFDCGSDLAYADPRQPVYKVEEGLAARLEPLIDSLNGEAPEITRFILPGGSKLAAELHVCRTVCRRAERRVVTLAQEHPINEAALIYLNRLSDFFFAAARAANARLGVEDVAYVRSAEVFHKAKKQP
ncbi:cob(I)yrinic acid a,c-diamide adenosyltransferase [Paenibacillus sp. IB182496]|uniref:Corrinoid adenosyltransferase n=1 Tax=Paenibacillus sabuli TaxID=2772509 RepID=A0A927BV48_9BACL|nr:cob(I)yrinic acid a,c-diamide adenosyltransferase [Paenibacillus sabuli]MBD2847407.1 cob(I)yrinic acid a,c-diamide adenosyltransferase [Paenibacillus sabuli]